MGYTPLFDSLTRGTLCGRWPDIGLWPIVLSLADKTGVVDVTAEFLASVTGLPLGDVLACMKRFCEPDPCSRSQECDGARLRLLDEHRSWGWLVINHSKYREKARLSAKAEREVSDGLNAARMADRRRPPETAADPLSKRIHKHKKKEEEKSAAPPLGLSEEAWKKWREYRRGIGKPLKTVSEEAAMKKLAGFGSAQLDVVDQSIANGWSGLFPVRTVTASAPSFKTHEERLTEKFLQELT